jgi:hypothetical protein
MAWADSGHDLHDGSAAVGALQWHDCRLHVHVHLYILLCAAYSTFHWHGGGAGRHCWCTVEVAGPAGRSRCWALTAAMQLLVATRGLRL